MKTLISLAALFLSFQSFAGINIIDKGGGFAEMLVLKIDHNLPKTLQGCLQQLKYCGIDAKGAEALRTLTPQLSYLQTIPFEFAQECSREILISTKSIVIPSCMLYKVENEVSSPLSVQELSHLVLTTRLVQARMEALEPNTTARLFQYFYLTDIPHVLDNGTKKIVAHITEYGSSWYNKEFFLSVETLAETLDITQGLHQALCGSAILKELKLSFERKIFLTSDRFLFEGQAVWECSFPYRQRFKGVLSVSGLVAVDSKLPADSVSLRLRQKESLPQW